MTINEFFGLTHEKFSHIQFEPSTHVYTDLRNGNKLTSVTTSIERFKKPFDKDFWLAAKAKELGITVEELEKDWAHKKLRGQLIGNRYHDYMERRFAKKAQSQKPIAAAEQYLLDYPDIPVFTEYIVGNDVISGTVDHIALRGESLVLKDWKSNKKFYTQSRYRFTGALEHLPSSEFYTYALQTSLYRLLLEPIPIERQECVWFYPPNKEFLSDSPQGDKGYIVFIMPYLRDEAQLIIDTIKNDNSAARIGTSGINSGVQ